MRTKEEQKEYDKKRDATEERKAYRKEYEKKRGQTEERKAYKQTEEYKTKRKEYVQANREKINERQRLYRANKKLHEVS